MLSNDLSPVFPLQTIKTKIMFPIVFLWFMGRRWAQAAPPGRDQSPDREVGTGTGPGPPPGVSATSTSTSVGDVAPLPDLLEGHVNRPTVSEIDNERVSSASHAEPKQTDYLRPISRLKSAVVRNIFRRNKEDDQDERPADATSTELVPTPVRREVYSGTTEVVVDRDGSSTRLSAPDNDEEEIEDKLDLVVVLLKEVGKVLSDIRELVTLFEGATKTFWNERMAMEERMAAQDFLIADLKERLEKFEKEYLTEDESNDEDE